MPEITFILGYFQSKIETFIFQSSVGVVARLAAAREKPVFTSAGITHGGVILAVNVEEHQSNNAKKIMQQAGAIDLVNLTEKWNPNVWSEFRELQPPSTVS
jgi:hypothetical protein